MSIYGLIYLLGFILSFIFFYKTFNSLSSLKLCLIMAIGAILGGRLGYVLFYEFAYYLKNPLEILEIYKGGMSYHGGLIGLLYALYIYKREDLFSILDKLVYVALIIIPLGRIANFINGELWGTISYVPWAVIFEDIDDFPRHPVQIYEALAEGPFLYLFIKACEKYYLKKGYCLIKGSKSALYLIGYSLGRIICEIWREEDRMVGRFINETLSLGQILCMIMLICGFILFYSRLKLSLRLKVRQPQKHSC